MYGVGKLFVFFPSNTVNQPMKYLWKKMEAHTMEVYKFLSKIYAFNIFLKI